MHPNTAPLGLLQQPGDLSLATDLYKLTMAAAYFEHGMVDQTATFELFVRRLPPERGYLVVAGLEQAIQYLTQLRFDATAWSICADSPSSTPCRTVSGPLPGFRFTGNLNAMPEGTLGFANEPCSRCRHRSSKHKWWRRPYSRSSTTRR